MDKLQARRQYWFDHVVSNLIRQGKQSIDGDNGCAYRSEDGSRCAIGWLIPDEVYYTGFEGMSATDLIVSYWDRIIDVEGIRCFVSVTTSSFNNTHVDAPILSDLQNAHDQMGWATKSERWLEIFIHDARAIAIKYGLKWNFAPFMPAIDSDVVDNVK